MFRWRPKFRLWHLFATTTVVAVMALLAERISIDIGYTKPHSEYGTGRAVWFYLWWNDTELIMLEYPPMMPPGPVAPPFLPPQQGPVADAHPMARLL